MPPYGLDKAWKVRPLPGLNKFFHRGVKKPPSITGKSCARALIWTAPLDDSPKSIEAKGELRRCPQKIGAPLNDSNPNREAASIMAQPLRLSGT